MVRIFLFVICCFIIRGTNAEDAENIPQNVKSSGLQEVLRKIENLPTLNRVERRVDENGRKRVAFFGLGMKWRLQFPIQTLDGAEFYRSRLQAGNGIKLPYSAFKRKLENRRYDPGDDDLSQYKRKKREAADERLGIFKTIENMIETYGLPAKECILRTICEVAEVPFEESLLGESLNIIFRASIHDTDLDEDFDDEYLRYFEAEKHGKHKGLCHTRFHLCPKSIFDYLPWLSHSITSDV